MRNREMEFSESDTRHLLEIMRWRRDVRHFKQDAIGPSAINTLKQAMEMAPSVGNSRPWRVVEVKSPETRERIIENFTAANAKASEIYSDERRTHYINLKLAGLREAPLQLAIFTDPDPEEGHGLGRQTMPQTLEYSTVAAIHQLWLAARAMNIGVGWVSIIDDGQFNKLLSVDPSWKLTGYLCIGYPKEASTEPELQREGWQENDEPEWLVR